MATADRHPRLPACRRPGWPRAPGGRSPATPERRRQQRGAERDGGCAGRGPRLAEVARRVLRVGRQLVGLGLVEQQEERAEAADAVAGVAAVELGGRRARVLQPAQALPGALAQVVELAELDRVRRARLRARRLLVVLEPVVAERALPHAAVLLALVEHAERARGHAVAAAVADVLLHDHGAELRAEQGAGRADLQARGLGAVLADVRGHQPPHAVAVLVGLQAPLVGHSIARRDLRERTLRVLADVQRLALLDERDVPPGVRTEVDRVVVGLAREGWVGRFLRDLVPLLAGDLARLATDADRRVGEEAHARALLGAVRAHPPSCLPSWTTP